MCIRDRFDSHESFAVIGSNAQVVLLVHGQIHAMKIARAAYIGVEGDDLRGIVLAAFFGQQVNLRDKVAAGLGFLAAAGVAHGFTGLVDHEPVFIGMLGHVPLNGF